LRKIMAPPSRTGLKGWFLNQIESRGYLLLNTRKMAKKDTWLSELGIKTVLDVGANQGESAIELHEKLPTARVVSFEPLPDSYQAMVENLQNASWWRGFNLAAGAENGEAEIHRSEYALSSSLLPMAELHKENYPYTAGSSVQKIKVTTLDHVLATENITGPFLLKLDVQGFEMPALSGATQTLKNCTAIICETSFVELYQGQQLFGDVAQFLQAQGFVYVGSAGQRNSPLTGRPLQQDAIFLKSKP
jgi:FkbM family methyltransferase